MFNNCYFILYIKSWLMVLTLKSSHIISSLLWLQVSACCGNVVKINQIESENVFSILYFLIG
jgi:hypothetical protein